MSKICVILVLFHDMIMQEVPPTSLATPSSSTSPTPTIPKPDVKQLSTPVFCDNKVINFRKVQARFLKFEFAYHQFAPIAFYNSTYYW